MKNNLFVVLLTFLGFNAHVPKYDLRRKPTREDYKRKLNFWIVRNWGFIALAAVIILLIIFTIFVFWIVGVSATEDSIYSLHKVI